MKAREGGGGGLPQVPQGHPSATRTGHGRGCVMIEFRLALFGLPKQDPKFEHKAVFGADLGFFASWQIYAYKFITLPVMNRSSFHAWGARSKFVEAIAILNSR